MGLLSDVCRDGHFTDAKGDRQMLYMSEVEFLQLLVGVHFEIADQVALVDCIGGFVMGDVLSIGKVYVPSGPVYDWVCFMKPG